MFAALTNAVSESAMRRRRGCSSSITFGVTTIRPTSSRPSSEATSHDGPAVRRSGSSNSIPIAANTVSCAGQNASLSGGGGKERPVAAG